MSGAQTSTFADPNILLRTLSGQQTADVYGQQLANQQNQLMMPYRVQQAQQTVAGTDIEYAARAAQGLLGLNDESAMAAAYPGVVADAQRYGFLKNAPSAFPGKARLQQIALMGTPSEKQAEFTANRQFGAALNPPQPTSTTAAPASTGGFTPTGTIEPEALTRATAVRDGLIKRGLDPDTATAFAANALHESSANPNTGAGDAGASHGLFQWRDARATAYQQTFGHAPDNAPLDEQLDNVVRELSTTEGAARDRIAAAQGPAAKAAAVSQYYLRPKDVGPEMQRRGGTALQLASQLGGSGQPAGGGQVILGDSYASKDGLGGSGVVGAQPGNARPTDVLSQIQQQAQTGALRGKDVVISTGAVNAGGDTSRVQEQIQAAKDAGASGVTVVGVADGAPQSAATNARLQQIAQQSGARFVPAGPVAPDGIHPASYAPLRQAVRLGGTATAGPAAGAPAGSTAAPAVPQPPLNQALPGSPNGPAVAQQQTQAQAAPQPQITGPQPPALPPLNTNGLDARQQQMVDAAAQTGRISPADQVKMQDTFRQQNIALQQKAYSDYIQAQQLAVAQGHLTVDQANSNLEHWKAANDLDITKTGDELIVTNKRTGQVVSRTPITPDMRPETMAMNDIARLAPKIAAGPYDAQSNPNGYTPADATRYSVAVDTWRQPELVDSKITGEKLRVNKRELPATFPPPLGEQGSGGNPQVVVPGYSPAQQDIERDPGKAKVADEKYGRDSKEIASVTDTVRAAQQDNMRVQEMLKVLDAINTGPGSTSGNLAKAWFSRWNPAGAADYDRQAANLSGPAAAEVFQKLAFKGSVSQEARSSSRGGYAITKLFQNLNPGMDLLNPANKNLLNMQLISNQADIDYGAAANEHFTTQEQRYGDTHKYDSLQQFEQQWIKQRNPEVYNAAIGALNGQPPEQWSKGLSPEEKTRAINIVHRAAPSATINETGGTTMKAPPAGFKVIQ